MADARRGSRRKDSYQPLFRDPRLIIAILAMRASFDPSLLRLSTYHALPPDTNYISPDNTGIIRHPLPMPTHPETAPSGQTSTANENVTRFIVNSEISPWADHALATEPSSSASLKGVRIKTRLFVCGSEWTGVWAEYAQGRSPRVMGEGGENPRSESEASALRVWSETYRGHNLVFHPSSEFRDLTSRLADRVEQHTSVVISSVIDSIVSETVKANGHATIPYTDLFKALFIASKSEAAKAKLIKSLEELTGLSEPLAGKTVKVSVNRTNGMPEIQSDMSYNVYLKIPKSKAFWRRRPSPPTVQSISRMTETGGNGMNVTEEYLVGDDAPGTEDIEPGSKSGIYQGKWVRRCQDVIGRLGKPRAEHD